MACLTIPASTQESVTIESLFVRYRAGDFGGVNEDLRRLFQDPAAVDAARRTIASRIDAWPRRAAASFALEAAASVEHARSSVAMAILESGCGRLRGVKDDWAQTWHRAAAILVLGPRPIVEGRSGGQRGFPIPREDPDTPEAWSGASQHLAHAIEQFPREPALHFARGIENEQHHFNGLRAGAVAWANTPGAAQSGMHASVTPGLLLVATDAYRRVLALGDSDWKGRATLHLGAISAMRGKGEEALSTLARVPMETNDTATRYLARLWAAQTLWELGRQSAATEAYNEALALVPHAKSAVVPLAALLFLNRQQNDAEKLVTDAAAAPTAVDPWWTYLGGDLTAYRESLVTLRRGLER